MGDDYSPAAKICKQSPYFLGKPRSRISKENGENVGEEHPRRSGDWTRRFSNFGTKPSTSKAMTPIGKVKDVATFDFSTDPAVIAANAKRTILAVVDPEGKNPTTSSVVKTIEEKCQQAAKLADACSEKKKGKNKPWVHHLATLDDFRMANGNPIQKAVLPVITLDNESESTAGDLREGTPRNKKHFSTPGLIKKGLTMMGMDNSGGGSDAKVSSLKDDPALKMFDEHIISLIESEIMSVCNNTSWDDVAGLAGAKKALREIVVLPFKRPDVFKGLRAPPKGVLLFGPPGTGKTMIGRCVASQCNATFFNISASSLTSKWVGEGEKLVRSLFTVARLKLPSVIFIDEIDSLLSARSESEHESSRRIKTEFLVQLDGVSTSSDERLLVLGATNRPQELDEAARRRFAKRLYIALPETEARASIVRTLLHGMSHNLEDRDFETTAELTQGYSGADMRQLCAEAAMRPIREIDEDDDRDIETVPIEQIRPINVDDFQNAARVVRPTVVDGDLVAYKEWDQKFGCLL